MSENEEEKPIEKKKPIGLENGTPFLAKVHGQGKITLPKNVRDLYKLEVGDYVEMRIIKKEAVSSS